MNIHKKEMLVERAKLDSLLEHIHACEEWQQFVMRQKGSVEDVYLSFPTPEPLFWFCERIKVNHTALALVGCKCVREGLSLIEDKEEREKCEVLMDLTEEYLQGKAAQKEVKEAQNSITRARIGNSALYYAILNAFDFALYPDTRMAEEVAVEVIDAAGQAVKWNDAELLAARKDMAKRCTDILRECIPFSLLQVYMEAEWRRIEQKEELERERELAKEG